MASSIRTEIGIGAPGDCPVAQASADTDSRVSHVSRSSGVVSDGGVTEEFTIDSKVSLDEPGVDRIFESESQTVFRFDRDRDWQCPCERIEHYGCPVSNVHARDGTLFISFYGRDLDTVQTIINDLHESFDDIRVRQLTRTEDKADHDFVFVDRNRLTSRQREVLETGYRMGYFDHPKEANAGDVAEELGIAPSTFSEHLAAAQRKILEALL
jgi:predicted DNA binding protein